MGPITRFSRRLRETPYGKFLTRWVFDSRTSLFGLAFWKRWFSKPQNDITVLLLSKQHLEVQKIKLSPSRILGLKVFAFFGVSFALISTTFFFDYLITLPQRSMVSEENKALRAELDRLQFSLDTLQTSIDRMSRFDQKLRALTEVDKQFARNKGPRGQGGSEDSEVVETNFDFGDYVVDAETLKPVEADAEILGRRESFLIQKMYSVMRGLFKDAVLQEQSLEELFEVLKGREIQLAATPSILPVSGWVTSHFGYRIDPFNDRRTFHRGMDIAAKEGAPIVAPADGVVTFSGLNGGFGKTLMLFHGYGMSSLYGHLDSIVVRDGQRVNRGEVVAHVGNSGRSTGSHLHYEVTVHGVHVDPRKFVLDRAL